MEIDLPLSSAPDFQPFYCEENIWRLAQDPRCGAGERLVAVITGGAGNVAVWHQKQSVAAGGPFLWDYHVVLLVRNVSAWHVWDFACDLGIPIAAQTWLSASFPHQDRVAVEWQPRFRVMAAGEYVATLRSDRSHMRADDGTYHNPPPPWMPPGGGRDSNLAQFIDVQQPFVGTVLDLEQLRARLR